MPLTIAMQGLNAELEKSANKILPEFSAQLNINGNMPIDTNRKDSNSDLKDLADKLNNNKPDYRKIAKLFSQELARQGG